MPMWDEAKRRANLKKHGIDFEGCESIFDGPVVVLEDARDFYGEPLVSGQNSNKINWLARGSWLKL